MEVKFNLLCLPLKVFDLVLRSVNNPQYVRVCTGFETFPWGNARGWRLFQQAPLAVLHPTLFCTKPVGLHCCSETLPRAIWNGFLRASNGCVIYHINGVQLKKCFKQLLNAIQSLHRDLMPLSSLLRSNRCTEATIEPFVPIDDLLPLCFVWQQFSHQDTLL